MISWQERDIEDYLCNNYEEFFGGVFLGRQVDIGVGVIDILLYDPEENSLTVIELKKETVDENAIGQIMRYMAGLEDYIEDISELEGTKIKGYLVGINISETATTALRYVEENISFLSYKVRMDITLDLGNYVRNKNHETYKPGDFYKKVREPIEEAKREQEELIRYHEEYLKAKKKVGEG